MRLGLVLLSFLVSATVARSAEFPGDFTIGVSARVGGGVARAGSVVTYTVVLTPLEDRDLTLAVKVAPGLEWARVSNWSGCATLFRVTDEKNLEVVIGKASSRGQTCTLSWRSRIAGVAKSQSIQQLVYVLASPDGRALAEVPQEEWLGAVASYTFTVNQRLPNQRTSK